MSSVCTCELGDVHCPHCRARETSDPWLRYVHRSFQRAKVVDFDAVTMLKALLAIPLYPVLLLAWVASGVAEFAKQHCNACIAGNDTDCRCAVVGEFVLGLAGLVVRLVVWSAVSAPVWLFVVAVADLDAAAEPGGAWEALSVGFDAWMSLIVAVAALCLHVTYK